MSTSTGALPAPTTAAWRWYRGETAGLLVPIRDVEGDPVDPSLPEPWPATARIHPEPGDDRVLHEFTGDALEHTHEGVHLHVSAAESRAATWRRGWLEVVLTDSHKPTETAVVLRTAVVVTP